MGAPLCTHGTCCAGPKQRSPVSVLHRCSHFRCNPVLSPVGESAAVKKYFLIPRLFDKCSFFPPVCVSLSQLQFEFMLWLADWVKFGVGAVVRRLLAEAQALLLGCTTSFPTAAADLPLTVGAG